MRRKKPVELMWRVLVIVVERRPGQRRSFLDVRL
jgi:hypothetical protein